VVGVVLIRRGGGEFALLAVRTRDEA